MQYRSSIRLIPPAIIVLCLCMLPDCAYAPASEPYQKWTDQPARTLSPEIAQLIQSYDRFFQEGMTQTGTPGAAVVMVKDGEIIFTKGYGLRETGKPDSVDAHTVFRIGSLSKGFAGVLTGMITHTGKLHWDDPVQQFYPEFALSDPKQAKRVAVRHILSQTTGLPYHAFTNLIEQGYSLSTIVQQYFPKARLSAKEGAFYSYQNAAFCVIEEVLRGATQLPYPTLLQQHIFNTCGMETASCDYASMAACTNKALPHFSTGYGWRKEPVSPHYYDFAAAGGVNASATDMGKWLQMLLGGFPEFVDHTTLDEVFAPVIKTSKERRIFPHWIGRDDASYAMGWRVLQRGPDTYLYHGGYVNGYRGEIAFNRKENVGICILFNGSSGLCSQSVPQFFELYDELVRAH